MRNGTPEWETYLALVGGFASAIALGAFMPSYWQRPNKNFERTPWFWVWGDALFRGLIVRPLPLVVLSWSMGIALFAYIVIVGRDKVSPAIFWGWFVLFAVQLTAWATIALLNWPKVLVPPYLRSEPGAVEVWARQAPRWRRILRAVPSMFVAWTAWMAVVVYVASRPAKEPSPVIDAGLLGLFFAACALVLMVILVGRPRSFVPRYLRDGAETATGPSV